MVALDRRRGRCSRARTRAWIGRAGTRRSSRWPAFRSNRWFPRDCGFRTVTHRSQICTGIRSATPSALPGGTTFTAEAPQVDVAVNGGLDLRLLGAFAPDIATGGTAQADFTVSGPLRSPRRRGSHRCDQRGAASGRAARSSRRSWRVRVRVDESRTAIISMAGTVNGGAGEARRRDRRHDDRRSQGARDAVGAKRGARIPPRTFRRNRMPTSLLHWRRRAPPSPGASTSLAARIANRCSSPARCFRACARASTPPAPMSAVSLSIAARSLAGLGRRRPHRQQLRPPGPLDPSPDRRAPLNGQV